MFRRSWMWHQIRLLFPMLRLSLFNCKHGSPKELLLNTETGGFGKEVSHHPLFISTCSRWHGYSCQFQIVRPSSKLCHKNLTRPIGNKFVLHYGRNLLFSHCHYLSIFRCAVAARLGIGWYLKCSLASVCNYLCHSCERLHPSLSWTVPDSELLVKFVIVLTPVAQALFDRDHTEVSPRDIAREKGMQDVI